MSPLMSLAQHALKAMNVITLVYFFAGNGAYTILTFISLRFGLRERRRLGYQGLEVMRDSGVLPPVTVIIPAYNEEQTILETVNSVRQADYPDLSIIVVDDGSSDSTLNRLIVAFQLRRANPIYRALIPTGKVRALFSSPAAPNLVVISKENGGKADALNTGINSCRTPYFCTLDADSWIEPDALLRLMRPIVQSSGNTIVSGGAIRIRNGCKTAGATMREPRLPISWLERLQVVEYLRTFLFGRAGWNAVGGTMIVSGAMAVFHRQHVLDAGGYSAATVGEDIELILRLRRYAKDRNENVSMAFSFDAVCWTQCPGSVAMLKRQRRRWQLGLCQTLWHNKSMLLNPKYGTLGLCSFPFHVFVEGLGAVVEFLGYLAVPLAFALHLTLLAFYIPLVIFSLLYASLLSVGAILLEELTCQRYPRRRDLYRLLADAMIDNFGYRQLTVYFRFQGFLQFLAGIHDWENVSHTASDECSLSTVPMQIMKKGPEPLPGTESALAAQATLKCSSS